MWGIKMHKLLLILFLSLLAPASQAAVVAYTWEENGDLLTQYSGSLDVTGLSFAQGRTQVDLSIIRPDRAFYFNMFDYNGYFDASHTITGPGATIANGLSSISTNFSHTRQGDQFGYGGTSGLSRGFAVYTAFDYVNGSSISGGSTTNNTMLADLGLTDPVTVSLTWSTDSITHFYGLNPNMAAVPLPAGFALLLTGIGAFALLGRRRKLAA